MCRWDVSSPGYFFRNFVRESFWQSSTWGRSTGVMPSPIFPASNLFSLSLPMRVTFAHTTFGSTASLSVIVIAAGFPLAENFLELAQPGVDRHRQRPGEGVQAFKVKLAAGRHARQHADLRLGFGLSIGVEK